MIMKKEWWKTFFDENYLALWGARGNFENTKSEVDFIVKKAISKKSGRILDLCCGHGRHSLELAKRGYKVTGLDYSDYELSIAKKEALSQKLKVNFIKGDARKFNLLVKFDLILNLFTAFGYGTKDEDRHIIQKVHKHLVKGGYFFTDLMSLPWLWRNYLPFNKERAKNVVVDCYRSFDFLNNVNTEKRVLTNKGKKKIYYNHLHIYSLVELNELLSSEGLKVLKVWGTYKGDQYTLDTKRMIVLAKKL